eukprot:2078899-Amphidinium_carterae.1
MDLRSLLRLWGQCGAHYLVFVDLCMTRMMTLAAVLRAKGAQNLAARHAPSPRRLMENGDVDIDGEVFKEEVHLQHLLDGRWPIPDSFPTLTFVQPPP